MLTRFTLLDKEFQLFRYPKHLQHKSWQAWDSADELLIDHVEANVDLSNKSVRIYNDDFGALACWFHSAHPIWINDSFVAQKSCLLNLEENNLQVENLTILDSIRDEQTAVADIVLLKIPKSTALLEQQLIDLQKKVTNETQVIAAGKAKAIQKSTLALFEKYLGPTTTSLAKKKSRLIFCQPSANKNHTSPYPTVWHTDKPKFKIHNLANVFARQQLDIGARMLLQHIPACNGKKVIDLGCGNGVIGLYVLKLFPDSQVVFVDESYMAIESAKLNVEENLPEALNRCEFLVSNCLDEYEQLQEPGKAQIILCNPPFHQQNAITDHIAYQMFVDAKQYLQPRGELRIIGNRHLDYPQKLKRLFGGYNVVASDRKFSILSAIKR